MGQDEKKEKKKIDLAVIGVILVSLASVALIIGGLIVIFRSLFVPGVDQMFQGIMYGSMGLIILFCLAIAVAYQKTIEQMNEYLAQANKLVQKSQTSKPRPQNPNTVFLFGGNPGDMTEEQIKAHKERMTRRVYGENEFSTMSIETLLQELKKAEASDNFERAAKIIDEIIKRKEEED
jgi:hypothetical protein